MITARCFSGLGQSGKHWNTLEKWHFVLREKEVSEMLGVRRCRLGGEGKPPAFIRLGRAARYRLSDLRELIRQGGYANRPGGGQHAS